MDLNIQLPAGYILLANHKNMVVLAQSEHKETPEPYVTWLVSNGSDVHTGSYFASLENAEHSFCERAFPSAFCTDEVSDLGGILRDNHTMEELKEQYRQQEKGRIEVLRNRLDQAKQQTPPNLDTLEFTEEEFYYEDLIQNKREARNGMEKIVARTKGKAGWVLANIGLSHPAAPLVFKYFQAECYPKQDPLSRLRY